MSKRATISDVARLAKVSLMSVSRAMNNRPGLSEETRQRILQIADNLSYRPSQIARGLVTHHSAAIGLVMPDVANPFFAQIARGAEDAAYQRGYCVFLINTAENITRETEAFDSLWQKEVDGVILCSPRLSLDKLKPYIERFPAAVLVNRELDAPIPNVATINVDYRFGAQQAIHYLAKRGRNRISFIAGPVSSVSSLRRLDGYQLGLKSAHLVFDPSLVEHCPPDTEGGRTAALLLFERVSNVDAAFCFNDLVAVGVMQACTDSGRRVPKDIAVIGADDIPLASLVQPRLTTLGVDLNAIGQSAMLMLLEIINGNHDIISLRIRSRLTIRDSA